MNPSHTLLHGPGIYYFRLSGTRQQPIFRSVLEYDYGTRILSQVSGTTLLAYTLFDNEIHCVMDCKRDWPEIIEEIRNAFADQHERVWEASRAVISEEVRPVLIDENVALVSLIVTLHYLPVQRQLLPDASMYPWSSDHYYRSLNTPDWLDCGRALNQLCQTRHNRALRYASLMDAPHEHLIHLEQSDHETYLLFGRAALADKQIARAGLKEPERSESELQRLTDDAIKLISDRFGVTSESLQDRHFRRQYQRLMPLVAWLLTQRQLNHETVANLLREDDAVIPLWLRGISADHPQSLLDKLQSLWMPVPRTQPDDHAEAETSELPTEGTHQEENEQQEKENDTYAANQ